MWYRTGTLEPGDHLLAIDDIHLETFSVEEAAHILRQADDIVKLRVKKDETFSGTWDFSEKEKLICSTLLFGTVFYCHYWFP